MAGTTYRVRRVLTLALIGVICATSLIPAATSADTNLIVGGPAVIAYANGDQVRLRQDMGYESAVLANYSEGTWVDVQDGPFTDSEGNYWYQVTVGDPADGGLTGYIVADYLALESGVSLDSVAAVEQAPEPVAETQSEATAPATGVVIGIAWVAGTNGDGVRCRTGADATAPVVTVVPEGSVLEITGVLIEGWQPVNCAGNGGFVSGQFVSYQDPAAAPAPVAEEQAPAQDESGDTPELADAPVKTDDQNATEEETVSEEPVDTGSTDVADAPVVAGTVTGKMVVAGTNGDGVRCRARAGYDGNVVTVLPEGVSVDLNGAAQGDWQPVFCGGTSGFVFAKFLGTVDETSDNMETSGDDAEVMVAELAVGGPTATAVVSGTNGDGVRCRNSGSYSGATIGVLSEGTTVTLRGDASGDWMPVTCLGQNGFVAKMYLSVSGTAAVPTSATTVEASSIGTAVVTSSGGLNCRSAASMTATVLTVLGNGSTVNLRSGSTTGWQAVICGGQNGFAASRYLSASSEANTDTSTGSTDAAASGYTAGASLKVSGTGGGGLRMRSAASYNGSVLSVIGEGVNVTVRSGSAGEWVAVSYNGANGFVHKDFVTASTGSTSSSGSGTTTNPGSTGSTSTALANGDHARVLSALNLRYSASQTAGVAAVAPSGTVVLITGSASNGYYPIDWDGLKGFMYGDYLTETTQAVSERGGSAASPETSPGGTQSGSASGNTIVNYAMRYLGYPYVWAAAGPSAFDCSGFIYWVVTNSTGKSIGRVLTTQISAGAAVSRNALLPGDLVFFQNTYQPGLSHGGIYIGNNQFIHSSNPSTGVMISDLSSSYYASRWLGAVRL
ncbi:MAG: NlpC/P60 family protein [Thermomicrobiales bacterium]